MTRHRLLNRAERYANCELPWRIGFRQEPLDLQEFRLFGGQDRTPENRGVPGSSPGLATAKTPMASAFSCFRSGWRRASGYELRSALRAFAPLVAAHPTLTGWVTFQPAQVGHFSTGLHIFVGDAGLLETK